MNEQEKSDIEAVEKMFEDFMCDAQLYLPKKEVVDLLLKKLLNDDDK